MIQGAKSLVMSASKRDDPTSRWLVQLTARVGWVRRLVALTQGTRVYLDEHWASGLLLGLYRKNLECEFSSARGDIKSVFNYLNIAPKLKRFATREQLNTVVSDDLVLKNWREDCAAFLTQRCRDIAFCVELILTNGSVGHELKAAIDWDDAAHFVAHGRLTCS